MFGRQQSDLPQPQTAGSVFGGQMAAGAAFGIRPGTVTGQPSVAGVPGGRSAARSVFGGQPEPVAALGHLRNARSVFGGQPLSAPVSGHLSVSASVFGGQPPPQPEMGQQPSTRSVFGGQSAPTASLVGEHPASVPGHLLPANMFGKPLATGTASAGQPTERLTPAAVFGGHLAAAPVRSAAAAATVFGGQPQLTHSLPAVDGRLSGLSMASSVFGGRPLAATVFGGRPVATAVPVEDKPRPQQSMMHAAVFGHPPPAAAVNEGRSLAALSASFDRHPGTTVPGSGGPSSELRKLHSAAAAMSGAQASTRDTAREQPGAGNDLRSLAVTGSRGALQSADSFTGSQVQMPMGGLFGKGAKPGTPSVLPLTGTASTPLQPGAQFQPPGGVLFGKSTTSSTSATATVVNTAALQQSVPLQLLYSELGDLTEDELAQFKASKFTLEAVPLKPPPRQLVH